jgi:hypothetical protein
VVGRSCGPYDSLPIEPARPPFTPVDWSQIMTEVNEQKRKKFEQLVEGLERGKAITAPEGREIAEGIHELVEELTAKKLREPCCSTFNAAIRDASIERDKKKHVWRLTDGFVDPFKFCPWCAAPRVAAPKDA